MIAARSQPPHRPMEVNLIRRALEDFAERSEALRRFL